MRINRRDLLKLMALAGPALWPPCAGPAFAQSFPSRPVRMVVPFAAGGPADITGRIVAQHLTELLGQQFYIDNRAGAGGVIGAETVVRAAPDGHTLLFSSNTAFSVTPAIKKNLSFDVKKDIAVISPAARGPQALVVRSTLGVNFFRSYSRGPNANPGNSRSRIRASARSFISSRSYSNTTRTSTWCRCRIAAAARPCWVFLRATSI